MQHNFRCFQQVMHKFKTSNLHFISLIFVTKTGFYYAFLDKRCNTQLYFHSYLNLHWNLVINHKRIPKINFSAFHIFIFTNTYTYEREEFAIFWMFIKPLFIEYTYNVLVVIINEMLLYVFNNKRLNKFVIFESRW